MPHFGLMDASTMPDDQAALQRARLHIRSGRRRLQQGKISAGVVTLYDALMHGMEWRFLRLEHCNEPKENGRAAVRDDRKLFRILRRGGHVNRHFDYDAFTDLVYQALDTDLPAAYPVWPLFHDIETVMTELGVMPFEEDALPPEDPNTF